MRPGRVSTRGAAHAAKAAAEVYHAVAQLLHVDSSARRGAQDRRWPLGQSLAFIAGASTTLWLAVVSVSGLLLS